MGKFLLMVAAAVVSGLILWQVTREPQPPVTREKPFLASGQYLPSQQNQQQSPTLPKPPLRTPKPPTTPRGMIGVKVQKVTLGLAKSFGMSEPKGALVAEIEPGYPAAKVGIQRGDIIIEFNGHPIHEMDELPRLVEQSPPGTKANLKVLREGKEKALNLTIVELTTEQQAQASKIDIDDFTFEALGCKRSGANIYCNIRVTNNSPQDKVLIIGGAGYRSKPSYLYDEQGNQYKATEVRFGSNYGHDDAGQTLSPSLPVIAMIKFENIPVIEGKITVRVGSTTHEWGAGPPITPVLRNIPLSE